ncbi:MAG: sigma-70 family RNA polymerase sigma factor [Clostridiales bacterium]|nr:sigma-70 family RNA polymerase sigma factor [Clostridiales bacterium]
MKDMLSFGGRHIWALSHGMVPLAILRIENEADRAFMQKLYLDYERMLYTRASRILKNKNDVEDAVNSACVKLISKISLLKTLDRDALSAYVVTTIVNTSFNFSKKRSRESAHTYKAEEEVFERVHASTPPPDEHFIASAQLEALYQAVVQLPDRESSIMRMKYYDGMGDAEIASLLGIKPDSIRVYLSRARKHLKDIMQRTEVDEKA